VTADTAGLGNQILSGEGLRAYAEIQKIFGLDEIPGIFNIDEWIVILVPAYIAKNVQKTTGLGDILSSTAFVADKF
jgi:ADP-dependent phosphofructokinase/glucokinase